MGYRNAVPLQVLGAIVLFVLSRGYILIGLEPQASDVSVYFGNAVRAIDYGETPYRGEFQIEFPPLAWWTMAAARLVDGPRVSSPPTAGEIAVARAAYVARFRMLMAAADVAAFALLLAIVRRRRSGVIFLGGAVHTVSTALLGHLLYDRLDAGVLLFFMLALYCRLRSSEPTPRAERWRLAAYAVAGAGGAYKVIPLLLIPFFLFADWRSPRRVMQTGRALGAAAAALALPFAVQLAASGPGVFYLLSFHSGRGIQIESLYASVMALMRSFGFAAAIETWEGGVNLTGRLAPAMIVASTVVMLAWLLGLGMIAVRNSKRADRALGGATACLAVAGAVALSRVFSPQYLIWALPLLVLVMAECCRTRTSLMWTAAAIISIAAITAWVFPHHYFMFRPTPVGLEKTAVPADQVTMSFVLLGVRNALLLAVVAVLAVRIAHVRLRRGVSDRGPDPVQVQPTNRVRAGRQQR